MVVLVQLVVGWFGLDRNDIGVCALGPCSNYILPVHERRCFGVALMFGFDRCSMQFVSF